MSRRCVEASDGVCRRLCIDFCNIDTVTITFNGGNNTFRATAQ